MILCHFQFCLSFSLLELQCIINGRLLLSLAQAGVDDSWISFLKIPPEGEGGLIKMNDGEQ
ncbi:hypothetical protein LptCag_2210 [Leptospirillum ferriphilum]|jgi:hypothetical protein|uniref:Uncharacterized protein n=1 Tax=Leptospirillum ferriphilum TaxID=178606 RepID=A0A094WE27_9BACT|nr:hypothetical protein LptCag_2210 [Leptospirillum ferriphilum]